MYTLNRPQYNSEKTLSLCIFRMQNSNKNKHEQILTTLVDAESQYISLATTNSLHQFPIDRNIIHCIDNEKLKNLYTTYLLDKKGGREVYEHILSLANLTYCPYCEYGTVGEVDHFLPKSIFPILSIVPVNLVPSCERCNRKKSDDHQNSPSRIFLHPYFEDVGAGIWLKAEIEHTEPYTFRYTVIDPGNWPQTLYKRVCNQFEVLELNTIYASQASSWLIDECDMLYDIYEQTGDQGIRSHLQELATSRQQVRRNYSRFRIWQIPLFVGLASDDWFCSEGIRLAYSFYR